MRRCRCYSACCVLQFGAPTRCPTAGTRTQIAPTRQDIPLSRARPHTGMGSALLQGSVSSPMQESAASHCRSGSLTRPGSTSPYTSMSMPSAGSAHATIASGCHKAAADRQFDATIMTGDANLDLRPLQRSQATSEGRSFKATIADQALLQDSVHMV